MSNNRKQPGVLGLTRCISVGLGLVSGRRRLGAAKRYGHVAAEDPMAEVEASVTSARGAAGSWWARRVARDKLSLQSEKAWRSSGVQRMG
jgi:hypothetical protein